MVAVSSLTFECDLEKGEMNLTNSDDTISKELLPLVSAYDMNGDITSAEVTLTSQDRIHNQRLWDIRLSFVEMLQLDGD